MFSSIDSAADAAKTTAAVFHGESILYKNPQSGRYYLFIGQGEDSLEFSRICNSLADYATKAYYEEHYEVIIRQDALGALAQL